MKRIQSVDILNVLIDGFIKLKEIVIYINHKYEKITVHITSMFDNSKPIMDYTAVQRSVSTSNINAYVFLYRVLTKKENQ